MAVADSEHTAWLWLMALPRVPIPASVSGRKARELMDRQIKITACPGKLNTNCGAPLVYVSILLPGLKQRVKGSGNCLYTACSVAHGDAWRRGVRLPFLSSFNSSAQ